MNKFLLSLILAISCSVGFCEDKYPIPEQKIVGADSSYVFGDVIDITLTDIAIDKKPKNLLSYSVIWRATEVAIDDGKEELKLIDLKFKEYTSKDKSGIFLGTGVKDKKIFVEATITYLFLDNIEGGKPTAASKTTIIRTEVVIGNGKFYCKPCPEPNPKPDPKPDPKPNPNKVDKLFIIVVTESSAIPIEYVSAIGSLMPDTELYNEFKSKGHTIGIFERDSKDSKDKNYRKKVEELGLSYPAMLLIDKNKPSEILSGVNCPKSKNDIKDFVNKFIK